MYRIFFLSAIFYPDCYSVIVMFYSWYVFTPLHCGWWCALFSIFSLPADPVCSWSQEESVWRRSVSGKTTFKSLLAFVKVHSKVSLSASIFVHYNVAHWSEPCCPSKVHWTQLPLKGSLNPAALKIHWTLLGCSRFIEPCCPSRFDEPCCHSKFHEPCCRSKISFNLFAPWGLLNPAPPPSSFKQDAPQGSWKWDAGIELGRG